MFCCRRRSIGRKRHSRTLCTPTLREHSAAWWRRSRSARAGLRSAYYPLWCLPQVGSRLRRRPAEATSLWTLVTLGSTDVDSGEARGRIRRSAPSQRARGREAAEGLTDTAETHPSPQPCAARARSASMWGPLATSTIPAPITEAHVAQVVLPRQHLLGRLARRSTSHGRAGRTLIGRQGLAVEGTADPSAGLARPCTAPRGDHRFTQQPRPWGLDAGRSHRAPSSPTVVSTPAQAEAPPAVGDRLELLDRVGRGRPRRTCR